MANTYIAAVRLKSTGRVFYRIKGDLRSWADSQVDATVFATKGEAERSIAQTSSDRYDKKTGSPAQVSAWIAEHEGREKMKKLQDQVNANIKKLTDFYAAPALFVSTDGLGGGVVTSNAKPVVDPIVEVIETYIEKAQKIEEEGADEFTWRGFLHAFMKDVTEAAKK